MQTIDQLIHQSCLRHSGNIALQSKTRGQWKGLTYAKLWDSVEKLASGLRNNLEIEPGTHIALLGPSSPRWVAAYLSILRSECIAVPIDKELKSTELRQILSDSDAEAVFVGQSQFETLVEIIDDLPQLKNVILIDVPLSDITDRSDVAGVLAKLSNLWNDLVKDLDIPDEKHQQIEALAVEAHALLTRTEEPEKEKKKINFLSPTVTSRNRLIKDNRLFAYKSLFNDTPLPAASNRPDNVAIILYTSGTTGRSKGAMLSHNNIVTNIKAACDRFQFDAPVSTLSFLPINHVFEQVCGVLLPLSLGGTVSFAESIKKLGENLNEIKPNFLLGVPAVYRLLLDRIMKNINSKSASRMLYRFPVTRKIVNAKVQATVGSETIFVSGGAALDPSVASGFNQLGLTLLQGYGITETAPVISAESPFEGKPGSVGRSLDQVEVKIDQPNEDGEGEILVKGPNVMLGYYKNQKATDEVLKDGWYHTGDLGRIDSDGMLHICGRVKNLIVTPNGKNVYPEEIENQLLKSPLIAEIMVYGHKVSPTAEEVYAVIFPDEEGLFNHTRDHDDGPLSEDDIEALIRAEILKYGKDLADYKRIKKFTLREDEFPKTTTRKIKRYVVEPEISTD